jgi:hypothetical protein
MLLPPGYTSLSSMKNTLRIRKALGAQKRLTAEELFESGTVVAGSVQTVRDELSRLREATDAGQLITMLQFGTMSDELTKRNAELFASEVMPHLRN